MKTIFMLVCPIADREQLESSFSYAV